MTSTITPVTETLVEQTNVKDAHVSDGGLVIADMPAVLDDFGVDLEVVQPLLPKIMAGGVQTAATGAVQDPAGSGVGTGVTPSGSGASGAIYKNFTDLDPIPNIPPGASVFNSSTGPGQRVLHTHSPQLSGKPGTDEDRGKALTEIANAYVTALIAFDQRKNALGDDGTLLNLTLVSSVVYSGPFKNLALNHLDPSYSLSAIAIAIHAVHTAKKAAIPPLTVYYYDDNVRANAEGAMAILTGA